MPLPPVTSRRSNFKTQNMSGEIREKSHSCQAGSRCVQRCLGPHIWHSRPACLVSLVTVPPRDKVHCSRKQLQAHPCPLACIQETRLVVASCLLQNCDPYTLQSPIALRMFLMPSNPITRLATKAEKCYSWAWRVQLVKLRTVSRSSMKLVARDARAHMPPLYTWAC